MKFKSDSLRSLSYDELNTLNNYTFYGLLGFYGFSKIHRKTCKNEAFRMFFITFKKKKKKIHTHPV